ncbi:MAG: hypothetical protein M3Z05_18880, partial [Gemmatimonadota bacterium]|nr:hypothetical protein [Gemmatimonadota bacterium]
TEGALGTRFTENGTRYTEYPRVEYVDFVTAALADRIHLGQVGHIRDDEFFRRLLALHRAYAVFLGVAQSNAGNLRVVSFRKVARDEGQLVEAQRIAGHSLSEAATIYRVEIVYPQWSVTRVSPDNHRRQQTAYKYNEVAFIGADSALYLEEGKSWVSIPK